MNTLTIQKETAHQLYAQADSRGKEILISLFGKDEFVIPITDRVRSYSDACAILGIKGFAPSGTPDEVAYIQLKTIIEALNEGWKPNWDDEDEYKYYPWWNMQDGFSLIAVNCSYGYSDVSSRLCFKSEALAKYAATQFLDIYKEFMLFK